MKRNLIGTLLFLFGVAFVVIFLSITNWLPQVLQEGSMKRYGTIEEMREKLKIRDLHVPAYIPQNLSWPPTEIMAQTRPYVAVVLEFRNERQGETVVVITQSVSADFPPSEEIRIRPVKERLSYKLREKDALLETGECQGTGICSRVEWREGPYHMRVSMRSTPAEVIRIAESMIR